MSSSCTKKRNVSLLKNGLTDIKFYSIHVVDPNDIF
jgi:hypothetical protein